MKYKIGDVVMGVKDLSCYYKISIVGKTGTVANLTGHKRYPYGIKFKEQVDFRHSNKEHGAYYDWFQEEAIIKINSFKLKKLLKD